MKTGFSICFIVLVMNCLLLPARAEPPSEPHAVYQIGGDDNFPPYEFVVEVDGVKAYRGFNVDIMKAVALVTGVEFEFQPMTWADAVAALDAGRLDAIQGMKYNAERAAKYDFVDYLTSSQIVFVRKDTFVTGLEDIKGQKIAVQAGDVAFHRLSREAAYDLVVVADQEEAFRLLLAGKVMAVVGNKLAGQYILQRTNQVEQVKMVGPEIEPGSYGVAVRKGDVRVLQVMQKGIAEIKKNGTYDRIYRKWFGEPVEYPIAYYRDRLFVAVSILAAALFVLALMLYLSYMLRQEVNRRTAEIARINRELIERMTLEQKLREEVMRKDKMEALGSLVAGIAHEIRTPLTSIKTFAELLPLKYDNPSFRQKICMYVPREIERVDAMVNNLLDYARPRKPEIKPVAVHSMVQEVLVLCGGRLKKANVRVKVQIPADVSILCDKQQIQQVCINILLNAVDALAGRPNPEVAISCSGTDANATLVFADNGCGMDAAVLSKIFDPFFTTKPAGTGLGLAISYQFVSENSGKLWAESMPDAGSKIFVQLPLARPQPQVQPGGNYVQAADC